MTHSSSVTLAFAQLCANLAPTVPRELCVARLRGHSHSHWPWAWFRVLQAWPCMALGTHSIQAYNRGKLV